MADSLSDNIIRICIEPEDPAGPDACLLVLEGIGTGTTVPANTLRFVDSANDINALFGVGTHLSASLHAAFACCENRNVRIAAIRRAPPAGGAQATYTLTVTGSATSSGRLEIWLGASDWAISVPVLAGDAAATIAAAINAAINNLVGFPFTATVAANVVTITFRHAGIVGNVFTAGAVYPNPASNIIGNWRRLNGAPTGFTITAAQTVVGTGTPPPVNYANIFQNCCPCCIGLLFGHNDADERDLQTNLANYIASRWDCDSQQCLAHGYTYNRGTLAQVLAANTNSPELSRIAVCNNANVFPWLQTAAYAAISCCIAGERPELAIQGEDGILSCLTEPEGCTACYDFDQRETLIENGFTTTIPYRFGRGGVTSPMIVADITNQTVDSANRPIQVFRYVAARRLARVTARELGEFMRSYLGTAFFSSGTRIRSGVSGSTPALFQSALQSWAKDRVGRLFAEFTDIQKQIVLEEDLNLRPECLGQAGVFHVTLRYEPPVSVRRINVRLRPKVVRNC